LLLSKDLELCVLLLVLLTIFEIRYRVTPRDNLDSKGGFLYARNATKQGIIEGYSVPLVNYYSCGPLTPPSLINLIKIAVFCGSPPC
jgi:hypothetical protein